jgi:multiple sugar transport system ATP-binding protein
MASLTMDHIDKVYEDGTHAVTDLSLQADNGEFLVLVGPSGCGKSTVLRMVAGLEEISAGRMLVGDRVINDVPAKSRDIAMVFQNYALYPHMSVAENMGFALRMANVPKSEIRERVRVAADMLGLSDHLGRKPRHLSGGERQRVAMGRAIVRSPLAFLMDEPLSNLDAKLRVQMRAEISQLQSRLGVTTLYVTHDQVEAMTMGDRVAVLKSGVLQQADSPSRLFSHPANIFVASFIGTPPMNLVHARVERTDTGDLVAGFGTVELEVHKEVLARQPDIVGYVGRDVAVGLRPDYFYRPDGSTPPECCFDTEVLLTEVLGTEVLVHLQVGAQTVVSEDTHLAVDSEDGADDAQRFAIQGWHSIVAKFPVKDAPRRGETIRVAFETTHMHFFDLESANAIS